MKNIKILAVAAALLCAACTKDEVPGRIELTLEPMSGVGKMAVDETVATWSDGDAIRFNGSVVTIVREGNGHAYIDNTLATGTNRAVYPATLVASGPAGDNISVGLPAEYQYRTDGVRQLLELPLAARAADDAPLHFLHLTGALCFTIENTRSTEDLTIDRITVASSGYQLSGTLPVDLTAIGSTAARLTATAADREVSMAFDRESLVVPHGESRTVVLPVAAVGDTNHFTVTVSSHCRGSRYVYSRRQTSGGSLARNQMGYVTVRLSDELGADELFAHDLSNTLLIGNASDFRLMVEAINSGWISPEATNTYKSRSYRLTSDIDLSGVSISPIHGYRGTIFDGDGYELQHLTVSSTNGQCGLFDTIAGSTTLQNITLRDIGLRQTGNSTELYIAPFCAYSEYATFSGCHVEGVSYTVSGTISGTTYLGGLTACVVGSTSMTDCGINATMSLSLSGARLYFGGLVAFAIRRERPIYSLTLSGCTVNLATLGLTASAHTYFGGMVGYASAEQVSLTECRVETNATISAPSHNVNIGGLVGYYTQSTYGSFGASRCSVSGTMDVTSGGATKYLGACIGNANGNYGTLDCTNGLSMTLNGETVSKMVGNN